MKLLIPLAVVLALAPAAAHACAFDTDCSPGSKCVAFLAGSGSGPAAEANHYGSGYFYNDRGDVMTARHVIENCRPETIAVRLPGEHWVPGRVIAMSRLTDPAAIATNHPTEWFGAIQVAPNSKSPMVKTETTDVFAATFSSPLEKRLNVQRYWGQIQPWRHPNEPPFMYRMRMDAAHYGAAGAPVLDYAALVVGVIVGWSKSPAPDPENLRASGYGDKWIYVLNANAIVQFVNEAWLYKSTWDKWVRQDPLFIFGHTARITVLIACTEYEGLSKRASSERLKVECPNSDSTSKPMRGLPR